MHNNNTKPHHTPLTGFSGKCLLALFEPAKWLIATTLVIASSACSLTEPMLHPGDYQPFAVAPADQRAIDTPVVRFKEVINIHEHCSRLMGKPPVHLRYFGCTTWFAEANYCVVYIPPSASYHLKGHELRHCFDGSFH